MIEIEQLWGEIDRLTNQLGFEEVALTGACRRVLAREACATADQPPFDQSAVDGYAIAGSGLEPFHLAGSQVAGQSSGRRLEPGEAVRILTGAVVPEGAFAVIKQEDCTLLDQGEIGERVSASIDIGPGSNIRRKGGVFKTGTSVLSSGTLITSGAIGLLAASGIASVAVVRRPRVLHLATGDEIVPAGTPLKSGQIHDSNGPMIAALLMERGLPPWQLRQVRLGDSSDEIGEAVAGFDGDLLLISGGSGPGDRDHTQRVLETEGFTIHASRLNSRPGKPLIFASRGRQIAFGLPGNPLSHFVCYHAFVRRVLDRLEGLPSPPLISAQLAGPVEDTGDGRRTWLPGLLETTAEGRRVRPLAWKHSGDLTPLAQANALILLGTPDRTDQSDPTDRSDSSPVCNSVEVLPLP